VTKICGTYVLSFGIIDGLTMPEIGQTLQAVQRLSIHPMAVPLSLEHNRIVKATSGWGPRDAMYSARKKNEIMSFAGKQMELEITVLSEVSQTEKDR
jgi:hypothetical protein